MAAYLVNQIILGKHTYQEVITARPDLQNKIDTYIAEKTLAIDKTS